MGLFIEKTLPVQLRSNFDLNFVLGLYLIRLDLKLDATSKLPSTYDLSLTWEPGLTWS